MGGGEVLVEQQSYFVELRKLVRKQVRKTPDEVKAAVGDIKTALLKQENIARYVGDFLSAQVDKILAEMGGKPFVPKKTSLDEHERHAREHGALSAKNQ